MVNLLLSNGPAQLVSNVYVKLSPNTLFASSVERIVASEPVASFAANHVLARLIAVGAYG